MKEGLLHIIASLTTKHSVRDDGMLKVYCLNSQQQYFQNTIHWLGTVFWSTSEQINTPLNEPPYERKLKQKMACLLEPASNESEFTNHQLFRIRYSINFRLFRFSNAWRSGFQIQYLMHKAWKRRQVQLSQNDWRSLELQRDSLVDFVNTCFSVVKLAMYT